MAKSLGVSRVIVCINKLDSCSYDENRFNEVKVQCVDFLTKSSELGGVGYMENAIEVIPISALEGFNIIQVHKFTKEEEDKELAPWYSNNNNTRKSLIDLLKESHASSKGVPGPLRMPVLEILASGTGSSQQLLGVTAYTGKIESGSLKVKDLVFVSPANVYATVKRIEKGSNNTSIQFASVGTICDVGLSGIESRDLTNGSVICHRSFPLRAAKVIEVDVKTSASLKRPILPGAKVIVHAHSAESEATVLSLVSILDDTTGEEVKRKPLFIPKSKSAKLILQLEETMCIEAYVKSMTLGSVLLRVEGDLICRGTVVKIISATTTAM